MTTRPSLRRGLGSSRRAALAAVLALLACAGPAPAGSGAAPSAGGRDGLVVEVRARALAPGEAVRIFVREAEPRPGPPEVPDPASVGGPAAGGLVSVGGTFLGEALSFARTPTGEAWSAWAVVGFDEKPGPKTLAIDAKGADGGSRPTTREVRIAARRFPTEKLTVKEAYVEPPPDVQERIASETKRLGAIYREHTASQLSGAPFTRPVAGASLGIFGARRILNGKPRAPHPGLDLRAATGTPVKAAGPGRVALAEDLYFSGNTVILDHGEGLFTLYAHLSRIDVREGETVAQGHLVGLSGATGRVTGPHLHWGAKVGDRPFDPTALLTAALF